ncbi:MAG: hypothetical protein ACLFUR_06625 [Candidatus Hadarchaeia archaeon]
MEKITHKKVTGEYPSENAEVEVEYEDGEIQKVTVKDQGILGGVRNRSTIQGDHLKVVKKFFKDGFPE